MKGHRHQIGLYYRQCSKAQEIAQHVLLYVRYPISKSQFRRVPLSTKTNIFSYGTTLYAQIVKIIELGFKLVEIKRGRKNIIVQLVP